MDEEWALDRLREFVALTRLVQPPSGGGVVYMGDFASPVGSNSQIVASAQVVEKILERVLPRWRMDIKEDKKGRWQQHREAAERAIVELESRAELAAKLGDNSPTLNAGALHPWVWECRAIALAEQSLSRGRPRCLGKGQRRDAEQARATGSFRDRPVPSCA